MNRIGRWLAAVVAASAGVAGMVAVAGPADSTSAPAGAVHAVRSCPADWLLLPGHPKRRVTPPRTLPRPPGVRVGRGQAVYSVASDMVPRRHHRAGYQSLLGPAGYSCSGIALTVDEVSWATLVSAKQPSHAVTATFNSGQAGYIEWCAYLAVGGRRAEARQVAHLFGMTVRQCRQFPTPDLPPAARGHGVRLAPGSGAPFAVIIRAPRGSENTAGHMTGTGKQILGRKTTTATESVALVRFTSASEYFAPQTLDCALPHSQHATCVSAGQAFVSDTLLRSFGWSATKAAAAGRTVARALR